MTKKGTKKKHRCCHCKNEAKWIVMSSSKGEYSFYCDECVPRGCTCNLCDLEFDGEPPKDANVIWWTKADYENNFTKCATEEELLLLSTKTRQPDSFFYEYLDEKGRREPCCEIEYEEDGFEVMGNEYFILKKDIIEILERHKLKYLISTEYAKDITKLLCELSEVISYNEICQKFADIMHKYMKMDGYHKPLNIKFYRSVKYKMKNKKFLKDLFV